MAGAFHSRPNWSSLTSFRGLTNERSRKRLQRDRRSGAFETLERDRFGEFRAQLVARGPFDHGVGAFAPGQHEPDPRADLEVDFGGGHEAALGNIDHPRLASGLPKLAH